MSSTERLGRLGEGQIHLLRSEQSPPEKPTGLLVPRREAARAFQGCLQVRWGNTQVGSQAGEVDPRLGEKLGEIETRQSPLLAG